jgi:GWxTD domain-containing protein
MDISKLLKILICTTFVFASSNIFAQREVQATMNINAFYIPNQKPYIEVSLNIEGGSIEYNLNENKKYQANLEITQIIKQNDKILGFEKFNLKSTEYGDSTEIVKNMIDLQRFELSGSGDYEIDLTIKDINNDKKLEHSEKFKINFSDSEVNISDITITNSVNKTENKNKNKYSKSGFDVIPKVNHYFPSQINELTFYIEIYNTENILGKEEAFLISYHVENAQNKRIIEQLTRFSKKQSASIIPFIGSFNINNLYSGNYNLVIEIKNKENQVVARKVTSFQRNNKNVNYDENSLSNVNFDYTFVAPYNDLDSLKMFIDCLYPISTRLEEQFAKTQIKNGDKETMKKYLYKFWYDRNPIDPANDWYKYFEKVQKVNQHYSSTNKRGYNSDRGRVYLQYGPPNTITQQYNEPSSYPYEIWHYYNIGNFNNKRFIFFDRNLTLDDFQLLHSDLYGEVNNPRWRIELQQRTNQVMDLDQENVNNKFYGSDVDDFFIMPR